MTEEQFKLSKSAVLHVLSVLRDDPRKYYLMGEATESWERLTTAGAAILGKPVEEVKQRFEPRETEYARYVAEKETNDRLLTFCHENNINVNSPLSTVAEMPSIHFDDWWRSTGQYQEPVASITDRQTIENYRTFAKRSLQSAGVTIR